ncbi:MAG: GTPase ObgE [Gammaproteobacteria bacterium]|nr:GTPase ObgE [Gammaproteobacteria bacterium]
MGEGIFVDRAVIEVAAGTGGSGAEAFRREKGTPRGGPSGGDGGRGGDVVLVTDPQLSTLLDFSYRRHYRAERGQHGGGNNRTGRSGADRVVSVPPGTTVRDAGTSEPMGELLAANDRVVVARGGRGGRGNARFASSRNQAPTRWEPGAEGEARRIELELRLIADVGLVGEPNAGKSTLLSSVSAARPKVADYPFTTLVPSLGVVHLPDFRSFVLADIPGIIEGAHEGKGLGLRFLRHVERTRTLVYLIPADSSDPQAEYGRLRSELRSHSRALAAREHCLVVSKMDLVDPGEPAPRIEAPDAWGSFAVSAVTRRGLDELCEALWRRTRPK